MAGEQQTKATEAIEIDGSPELARLVEEVCASGEPIILRRGSEDLAILRPLKRPRRPRSPRGKPFTKDDPIWNLMGSGRSGLTDVSENTDKYLAEAYSDTHDEER